MELANVNWESKSSHFQEPDIKKGITWEDDCASRMEPINLTRLMHESIPATARAGLKFDVVKEGFIQMRLPLSKGSTNQHGTHQATIIALAGDYTGGAAVATLLRGVPIMGVHPIHGRDAMCLWLAGFEIEYYAPSCTTITAVAKVPESKWSYICDRFWEGRGTFLPLPVDFFDSSGNLVARARMTYYLKHSAYLGPREERLPVKGLKRLYRPVQAAAYRITKGEPVLASITNCLAEMAHPSKPREVSIMFEHMLKSSARLIANLRGRSCQNKADKASSQAAGEHGELLGNHFISVFPEIQEMVHSRTVHGDETLKSAYKSGVRQVVMVGAGLDLRPWKMPEDVKWFELDLPEMIQERHRVIESLQLPDRRRYPIVANFLRDDLNAILESHPEFDVSKPAVILLEGISMYFEPDDANKLLSETSNILKLHPDSRLWVDLPAESALNGKSGREDANQFLDAMAKLGEPFLFGTDDPQKLFNEHSMDLVTCTDSGQGDLFQLYKFMVVKRKELKEDKVDGSIGVDHD